LISLWNTVNATVFFIPHAIVDAVFLGDRVYVLSSSPGRLIREIEIEPADRPAAEMQKVPRFQETVSFIRDLVSNQEN
jgi:ABC-type nitrate/sulfonate/bicarbonate transport system ATPase subunit